MKLLVQGVGLQAVGKYARQMDALAKCRNQKVPFSGTVDSSRFPCVTSDKPEKSKMRVKQKVRSGTMNSSKVYTIYNIQYTI